MKGAAGILREAIETHMPERAAYEDDEIDEIADE